MKELKCIYAREKSFYKKAYVIEGKNNVLYLKSYDTVVCSYDPSSKEFKRYWNDYSNTTSRHVDEFRQQNNMTKINKKEWLALDIIKLDYNLLYIC